MQKIKMSSNESWLGVGRKAIALLLGSMDGDKGERETMEGNNGGEQ